MDKGKIRSIGVSNFNPHHLDELLEYARIRPVVNQIEIEPYMTQHDVVGYTFRKGIQVEAWGPLGQGVTGVLDDPAIGEIAARHGKSAAQVILRWHMQRGLVTIPAATTMRTRTRISVSSTSSFRLPKWRLLPV